MGLLSRKPIADIIEDIDEAPHRLVRTLGPFDLISIGLGCIIGAGLFSITGIAAAENAGPAIVISFLIAAIGCAFAGLCYSELAAMIPVSGSAYSYAYATMGELVAWIIGWDLILEYAIGAAAVAISWSAFAMSLFQDYHIYLPVELIASPWQPVQMPDGSNAYGWINLPAVLIVCAISFLLMRGIRQSSLVNNIIVMIKLAVVLIFIGVGYFYINPQNYHPFIPPNTGEFGDFGWSGVLRASGVVFYAYIGFDALSTVSQEVKKPQKNIPIGILGSLAICTVLYVLFSYVMTGIVHYTELDVAAPVAVAIDKTPFFWLKGLVKLAILCGFTSVILVLLLGQSRIFFAMSRDGMLPHWLSDVHPRFHTPWHSSMMLMVFVSLIAGFAPLRLVGHMVSIGTLLAFVIVCLGVLILRYTHPEFPRPFRTPWVPLVPFMGIFVCSLMIGTLGSDNWIRLGVWLAIGMVIYFGYSRKHAITF